jgi:hypothetical protein
MSTYDDPWNYTSTSTTTTTDNPRLHEKIYGDFTAFYVTVSICTVLGAFLFLVNIALCCCSRYKNYWQDSNTGEYGNITYVLFHKNKQNLITTFETVLSELFCSSFLCLGFTNTIIICPLFLHLWVFLQCGAQFLAFVVF